MRRAGRHNTAENTLALSRSRAHLTGLLICVVSIVVVLILTMMVRISLVDAGLPGSTDQDTPLSLLPTISTGYSHTCALTSSNQPYCWGAGTSGQLGNNLMANSYLPVAVHTGGALSGKRILSIATGNASTCVIASDSQVYCWGNGSSGQLGNGASANSSAPVAVSPGGVLSGKMILSISVGNGTACVIASDNQAYCWGNGSSGQLGNGTTSTSSVPVAVNTNEALSGKTLRSISVGNLSTCAIASDSKAYCWGAGSSGQLGNNTTTDSSVPVPVNMNGALSGKSITSVSAGSNTTCAIASDSKAYCWGAGSSGQLGNNTTSNSSVPVPVDMSGVLSGKSAMSISAGGAVNCLIASDSKAYCWGAGSSGQLGNGLTSNSQVPVAVNATGLLSAQTLVGISFAGSFGCAVTSEGEGHCWGSNYFGMLGNGTNTNSSLPTSIKMPLAPIVASTDQSVFRLYSSSSTVAPGSPLAATNTPGVLGGIADKFRVRMGITNRENQMIGIKSVSMSSFDYTHACSLGVDDRAYCWGSGSSGQLGVGNTASYQIPVAVRTDGVMSGLTIKSVKAGYQYSCALASDDETYCWGNGANGKLGNGLSANSNGPVAVSGGDMGVQKIKKLSTGGYQHSCAIAADNKVYCWGLNSMGQLGNGTTTNASSPVAVDMTGVLNGLSAKDVDVGFASTCIIASDNNAYCWGYNTAGMLGNDDGGANASQSRPVAVTKSSGGLSGKTVLSISVGSSHTCAIASDNNAYCWGYNGSGMIGDATTGGSHVVPTAVSRAGHFSDKTIKQIVVGANATCAIASDDQAYCWGNNELGRLGDGTTTNSNVPVKVDPTNVMGPLLIKQITVGYKGACVLTASATTYCWGANVEGQLGNGKAIDSLTPVSLSMGEMSNPDAIITTGISFSCAAASGKAYCWGSNTSARLGDGTSTQRVVPSAVSMANGALAGKTIQSISAGDAHTCVVADGKAYCWGLNGSSRLGFPSPPAQSSVPAGVTAEPGVLGGKTVQSISAGAAHTCAVAEGKAYCWGLNTYGRVGDGTAITRTTPVVIDAGGLAGKTVQSISAGNLHTCAIAESKAYCWGRNNSRQVGDGTTAAERLSPVVVETGGLAGKTVQSISTGSAHTCAVADGKAYCWGANAQGQLGDNSTSTRSSPVAVNTTGVLAGKTIESISAGNTYTCATTSEGKAYCWGYGSAGELGAGTTLQSPVPLAVDTSNALAGKTVQSISASRYGHTCVVASDNKVYCFGDNVSGQLGNGTTTNADTPSPVNDSGMFRVVPSFISKYAAKLQLEFAPKTSYSSCSSIPSGLWGAVTNVSTVSYDDNGPSNEAVISSFANDPTLPSGSASFSYQSAVRGEIGSAYTFTNRSVISPKQTSLWDFVLRDRTARSNSTYCLRVVADPNDIPRQSIDIQSIYTEFTTATGSLGVQFIDAANTPVVNPTTTFNETLSTSSSQLTSAALANTSSRRLEITNSFSNTGWSVTLAATEGPSAKWRSGVSTYLYNGANSTGQLSVNTVGSTFVAFGTTPSGAACGTTGLSIGSSASYDAMTPIITLASGSSSAGFNCTFRMSSINLSQIVPANQPGGTYTLPMTATVMAQ